MFKNYLKFAIRNLTKNKTYTIINVSGLAIGISVCFSILLFIQFELSFDKYHSKAEQIYRITNRITEQDGTTYSTALTAAPLASALVNNFPEILQVARFTKVFSKEVVISYNKKHFYENRFFYADQTVFDIFSFPLIRGNPKTALHDPYSIVITERMAEKYFGSDDPMGKLLIINGKEAYKITGILENVPENSHFKFDFLGSFSTLKSYPGSSLDDWGSLNHYTYVLVPSGFNIKTLEKKLSELVKKYMIVSDHGEHIWNLWQPSPHFQPLTDIHLRSHLKQEIEENSSIRYLAILFSIAIIVLLVACINYTNLTTSWLAKRTKEIGMRRVLGAKRSQLVKQYLSEALLLSFLALPLSVFLVEFSLPAFNTIFGKKLFLDYLENKFIISGFVGITSVTGLVAGSIPALFFTNLPPIRILKEKSFRENYRYAFVSKGLVIVQFIISIVFIIGTLVIYNQLDYMRNKNLGFDKRHTVVIRLRTKEAVQKSEIFKNNILKNPDIIKATVASGVPGRLLDGHPVKWKGSLPEQERWWRIGHIDYEYLETLGIQLIAGRNFSRDLSSDFTSAFIINEAGVKRIGCRSPNEAIGKQLTLTGVGGVDKTGAVIGVVKDFHFKSFHQEIEPLLFHIYPERFRYIALKIRRENISTTLAFLKKEYQKFVPNLPLEYFFLDEDFDHLYKTEERWGKIFGFTTVLAIFIAVIGLFGLASFAAEQRTKEIGIRKVLGASVPGIVMLLIKEFTKWVFIANIIAWPVAYFISNKWLQEFAYRINLGWMIFVFSAVLVLVIAVLTVSYQAIRAALANPVDSLRYE